MLSDISHISNIAADRGPAKYFHGRAQILHDFKDLMMRANDTVEGRTTMLIQGAPGAGKTALLNVLSERAKEFNWEVSKISIEDLYTPASMAQSLGKSYTMDQEQAAKVGVSLSKRGMSEV